MFPFLACITTTSITDTVSVSLNPQPSVLITVNVIKNFTLSCIISE